MAAQPPQRGVMGAALGALDSAALSTVPGPGLVATVTRRRLRRRVPLGPATAACCLPGLLNL